MKGDNPVLGDLLVLTAQLSLCAVSHLLQKFHKEILGVHADEMDVYIRCDSRHSRVGQRMDWHFLG